MTHIIVYTIIAAALAFTGYRVWFWLREGRRIQQSGYLPPPPTIFGRAALMFLTRLATFLFVGPVKVIGKKNARYKGHLLLAGNHQFELDFAVAGAAMPFAFRHLGVASEMTGVRGVLSAWAGFFGVQGEAGKAKSHGGGEAVVDTCARVLAIRGSRLLVFPQGKLVRENELRAEDFRTGSVRMIHRCHELVGDEALAILPFAVHYRRDPQSQTIVHRAMWALGQRWFRRFARVTNYGAVVVIGEPIPYSALPEDAHEATEVIRKRIDELLAQAKAA